MYDFTIIRWKIAFWFFQWGWTRWIGFLFLTREDCREIGPMLAKGLRKNK